MVEIDLIAEDTRFALTVPPLIEAIARRVGSSPTIRRPRTTRGCRPRFLLHELEALKKTDSPADLIVVGADSNHAGKRLTHRRKTQELRRLCKSYHSELIFAIADPGIEAWLLSDVPALRRGLEEALGLALRNPPAVPRLKSEQDAKHQLGRTIKAMTGERLSHAGFEYMDVIARHLDPVSSTSRSMAEFARECRARLLAGGD